MCRKRSGWPGAGPELAPASESMPASPYRLPESLPVPLVGMLLLCLLWSLPLAANTWYDHYGDAEKALAEERWQEAVDHLNQAIGLRGDSDARARTYGMKVTSYFPYLKLGIAYYYLGKHEAALLAFETEQGLGEISRSPKDLAELKRYRDLIRQAKEAAAEETAAQIQSVVAKSLQDGRRLQRQDRLDEALEALGPGLALAPNDGELLELLHRLQQQIGERQRRQEQERRQHQLIEQGKRLLDQQRYEEAASSFQQALTGQPNAEAEALLASARAGLRQQLDLSREDDRRQQLSDGMRRARSLAAAGEQQAALTLLQSLLTLDPANAEAQRLQARLLEEHRRQQQESAVDALVAQQLADAQQALAAGEPQRALALANRTLALAAGNAAAQSLVTRTYRLLNQELLDTPAQENLPPAISFIDARLEQADGTRLEVVRDRSYQLAGLIFDESPVTITVLRGEAEAATVQTRSEQRGQHHLTHFTARLSLPAGTTEYRLVAVDADGLTAASSYQLRYEAPLYQRPELALVLLLAMAALAGLVVWQRGARRRRLLRRRFNPYVAGAPVFDEGRFFGRHRLMRRVLESLPNNSILLYGERRIGKTSFQHQLRRVLKSINDPELEFYPVFIDLQGTPQERFFATIGEEVLNELGPLVDISYESKPTANPHYGYSELVRDLKRVVQALRARSKKELKVVLQIDEVDELNDYDPRVNQKLRSLFMKRFARNLAAVVSGVRIKKYWEREGSPWYNFFEEIEVTPLQENEARQLIEQPVKRLLEIDPELVQRIVEITHCKPYLIQKVCSALVSRAHETGCRKVTLADLEAISVPESS